MKKIVAGLLCIIMIASFSACSKKDEDNTETTVNNIETTSTVVLKDFETPEDMIEKTFNPILDGKMDWSAYWDNYTSKTTKDLKYLTKENFMVQMRKKYPILTNGYNSITITDRQPVDRNTYKVDFKLKFTNSNNEEVTRELTEYVVEESGQFKFVYDGIFRWKSYETAENEDDISITQIDVKYGYEKVDVDISFLNNADMGRFVGQTTGAGVTVKTDKKTYEGKIPNVFVMQSKTSTVATVTFEKLEGNLKCFAIKNIYEIDKNGKAVFTGDDGITFTLPLA